MGLDSNMEKRLWNVLLVFFTRGEMIGSLVVDDDCKTVGRALVFMDFFSSKGAESSNTD
jgi:hypothetical protein